MGQPGRFTADEPAYREAIGRLVYDAPLSAVRCPLSAVRRARGRLRHLPGQRPDSRTEPLPWRLPYRMNRWIEEEVAIAIR
ncbi:DUF5825 family protein [Streptomyces sp. NBC_01456]|uniref:DUF5825 family protein n=1 Tax=unclassified Streptomyces TaxID=2593676 RepID=UPI002E31FB01|nr:MULTISPECIES: DUF5825 family protein [unclassified Streptomyces]